MSATAMTPGFTAEASLARPTTGFRGRRAARGDGAAVVPAQVSCVERGNITYCYSATRMCWWVGDVFRGCVNRVAP
jgi:hypothetical protein